MNNLWSKIELWTEQKEYLIKNIQWIDIETSSACNRACSYCPNSIYDNASVKNSKYMPSEMFSKIVSDLWDVWYSWEVCLQRYNEPLMDIRLPDLVKIASEKMPEATIAIYSNWDYLNIDLYNKLVDSWVKKITITQHWKKMSPWLIEVIKYREKNPDEIIFKCKQMNENAKFYNRGWEVSLSINQPQNYLCKTLDSITINFEWNVILCCNDYHSEHIFGNAWMENIIDIYLSHTFQQVRMEAITWNFSREICNLCMYWKKEI